jgi:hypothetical protein
MARLDSAKPGMVEREGVMEEPERLDQRRIGHFRHSTRIL